MAEWNYTYQAADEGGSFENLSDYCTSVRIVGEGMSGKRGQNPTIPYRDGEFSYPVKFFAGGIISLDVVLRYTNASGATTHANGAAGHIHQNLASLKNLLGWGRDKLVVLRRNDPDAGLVETRVECLSPIQASGPRMRYIFPLRMVDGVWREQALQSDTQAAIAAFPFAYNIITGGNFRIGDPKITFTCDVAGNAPTLELDVAGDKISIAGAFVANDVIIVDLDRTRTITLNGSRYGSVSPNRAWWMHLPPSTPALGLILGADSGTWTVQVDWHNKWI